MGSTEFGNFFKFCRDSTLPVCNLLSDQHSQTGPWSSADGACDLQGITLSGNRKLGNLGSILLAGFAIITSVLLILRSARRKAAVGRLEMQMFLAGFILIEICEIFSVGEFPLDKDVRIAFTSIHLGAIIATTWILMLNAVVGYQVLEDGTPVSMGLFGISALVMLIGTGYIALDTGFKWTGYWDSSYQGQNRHIALYVLYQLIPLIFLVAFFILEANLVLRILGEKMPMVYLAGAAVCFAIGQVFNYAISKYICDGTDGKIDGAMFETFFTLISVVLVWIFWTTITEDEWPDRPASGYPGGAGAFPTTGGYGTANAYP